MIELLKNVFAKRGKGQKGQTFTAQTFGRKVSDEDDDEATTVTYNGLNYDHLKGTREQEIRNVANSLKLDVQLAMLIGCDHLIRREASGGGLQKEIAARLHNDGIAKSLDSEKRASRINSIAQTIMGIVRNTGLNVDDVYSANIGAFQKANP